MHRNDILLSDGWSLRPISDPTPMAKSVPVTTKIGSLTASSAAKTATLGHSQDSYEIGALDEDMTFYGLLKASRITKVGAGKLSLRTNGHTSPITVNGGTLEFYGSGSAAMTTGTITINAGGTLAGNNRVASVVINKGGVLAAGVYANIPGNIYMQNLTLHEGATLRCLLSASANSRFTVSGSIRHNGDTILVVVPANRKLNEDEELTIFPAGFTSASGEVIVKCETADGKDYMFDTSTLNSDGKIRVSAVCSGILDGITSNDTMVDVYTTSGIRLRSHVRRADALTGLPAGIYMMRAGTAAQNVVKRK